MTCKLVRGPMHGITCSATTLSRLALPHSSAAFWHGANFAHLGIGGGDQLDQIAA